MPTHRSTTRSSKKIPGKESSLRDRVLYIYWYFKWEPEDFVLAVKVAASKINDFLKGDDPDIELIDSMVKNIKEVNANWLLRGVGLPFVEIPDLDSVSNYHDINERFKQLRLEHNYTQQEWGVMLGLSRSTIGAIEAGRQTIQISSMRILKQKFGISYAWLIDGEIDSSKLTEKELKSQIKALEINLEDCIADKRALRRLID